MAKSGTAEVPILGIYAWKKFGSLAHPFRGAKLRNFDLCLAARELFLFSHGIDPLVVESTPNPSTP